MGWAPSFLVQGGKGPSGEVPGAGAGPPARLPPAARTRSPVRSLAEPAWQEAPLIAAEGPSRLPSRSLSRPGPGLRGLGPRPPVAVPTLGGHGNPALLLHPPICTSPGVTALRTRGRAGWTVAAVPPRGPSAPGHCLREGGGSDCSVPCAVQAEARSQVWE